MISVVIPVYNQGDKLAACLESLLRQTRRNIEVIAVNDGSSDNSAEIIKKYNKRFQESDIPYRHLDQTNKGAPAARNAGKKLARGEYILFCDADAVLYPQFLELTQKILEEQPEASFAYSDFIWGKKKFKLFPFDREKLKEMPYIHTMSLVRTKDLPSRGWDESLRKLQDWDLWLTMALEGKKGVWVNRTLFRIAGGGTISSWLPSAAYKLLPFLPQVKKYKRAVEIVKKKHGLQE